MNNYKNKAEFEEFVKGLGYTIDFTDKFIVDNNFYHVFPFHYNDDEGVYVGRDKLGCLSLSSINDEGQTRILDFVVSLKKELTSTYVLYFINDQDYKIFSGYEENSKGDFVLDDKGEKIPIYYETKGTISEVDSITMRQEDTYLGSDPENLYVFTYYGYKLIQQFLEKENLLSTEIKRI